MKNVFGALVGI